MQKTKLNPQLNPERMWYIPMTSTQEYFATQFQSDFKAMFTMPTDFDPKDKKTIQVFGERLKYLLQTAKKRNEENRAFYTYDEEHASFRQLPIGKIKQCQVFTAKELAKKLNVSGAAISQYMNGNIASVPEQHFFALYEIFGATPHYLTGYVDGICERLVLDEARRPVFENGHFRVVEDPFMHGMYLEKYAYYLFGSILYSSYEQFSIFSDFLSADKQIQNGGFAILRAYLDSHKTVSESKIKDKSQDTK